MGPRSFYRYLFRATAAIYRPCIIAMIVLPFLTIFIYYITGLIVVAAVLLGLDKKVDATALEHTCNWIVGVLMMGLGAWYVCLAFLVFIPWIHISARILTFHIRHLQGCIQSREE